MGDTNPLTNGRVVIDADFNLVRFTLQPRYYDVGCFVHWHDTGRLLLDPEYQRGEVWGLPRKQNLILSLIQHVPIGSLVINHRFAATDRYAGHTDWTELSQLEMAVIDGKQRLLTIFGFISDQFGLPGDWFGYPPHDQIRFCDLSIADRARFRNTPLSSLEAMVPRLHDEVELFNRINYGGVPQGQSDV